MKRILCILLALLMVFALCSCKLHFGGTTVNAGETSGETTSKKKTTSKSEKTESGTDIDDDDDDDDESDVDVTDDTDDDDDDDDVDKDAWTLNNTYYKLTHDKKLTVGYIGGSVTVGTGSTADCWRTQTNAWFKSKYGAEITEVNAAIGGSSSVWGAPRYQSWILDKKPDLVFIEFSINDYYVSGNTSLSEADSAAMLDSMIRQTQKKLPNCDIVVITVVDKNTVKGTNPNANGHQKAAEYEGVLWLDVTESLLKKVTPSLANWDYYFSGDAVHPNAAGYKVYSDYITSQLAEKFEESAKAKPTALKPHTLKAAPYSNAVPEKFTILYAKDFKYDGKWALKDNVSGYKFGKSYIYAKESGASVTAEFTGTTISLFGAFALGSNIEVTVDGSKSKTIATAKAAGEILLWSDLENKKHTITIKATGKVENESSCQIACIAAGTR